MGKAPNATNMTIKINEIHLDQLTNSVLTNITINIRSKLRHVTLTVNILPTGQPYEPFIWFVLSSMAIKHNCEKFELRNCKSVSATLNAGIFLVPSKYYCISYVMRVIGTLINEILPDMPKDLIQPKQKHK